MQINQYIEWVKYKRNSRVKLSLHKDNIDPQGIIYQNDNKVIVGMEHGKPLNISSEDLDKIKKIGDRYGYNVEGIGKDPGAIKIYTRNPKGSWDTKIPISKDLSDFCYTMFSNGPPQREKMLKGLVNNNLSIIDSLLANPRLWAHEVLQGKLNRSILEKFFKDVKIFPAQYNVKATSHNIRKFIEKNELRMWKDGNAGGLPPDGSYDPKVGEVAERANTIRESQLINMGPGVYFIGSGHLPTISKMINIRIKGGDKIEE